MSIRKTIEPVYRYLRPAVRFIRLLPHFGNKVQCPICSGKFRRFLPSCISSPAFERYKIIGGGYRENARCPKCFSLERERLMYLYLMNRTDIFTNRKDLLHFAPERLLREIFSRTASLRYTTADIFTENVDIKLDVRSIDLPSSSYDVIICNHVLEHIDDDRAAMKELFRILRSGGWAILQVPYSKSIEISYENNAIQTEEDSMREFGQKNHVRVYALKDYINRLKSVGFNVETFHWSDDESENRYHGLNPLEELVVCRKP